MAGSIGSRDSRRTAASRVGGVVPIRGRSVRIRLIKMTAARQDAPSTEPHATCICCAQRGGCSSPDELERLVPRARGGPRLEEVNGEGAGALDPLAATEAIAYDFLAKGGKYSRPFITLAAYDALTGGKCCASAMARQSRMISLATSCAGRRFRSNRFTKPRSFTTIFRMATSFATAGRRCTSQHGVPTAINVGDYLIGLGYRLVSRDTDGARCCDRGRYSQQAGRCAHET